MMKRWIYAAAAVLVAATVVFCAYHASAGERGKGKDRVLSKVRFIHFKKGHGKPPWAGSDKGGGKKEEEGYYTYIAKGAKWKAIEGYVLNPDCDENLSTNQVLDATIAGMDEWETPEEATLDIFGKIDVAQTGPDSELVAYRDGAWRGYNTISFGSYGDANVIAETTVWGYFTGRPSEREIVEAHIQMNDDVVWGDATVNTSLMDVQNIMTHELGHCAGMGDLYELAAGQETMYGYSEEGETKKRDLYKGDVTGITDLYK